MLTGALFGSAEIAYNVFEPWRGGEAARIYGRVIGMVSRLFAADSFTIVPYQLGDDNQEAIESGASWFYQKLGFRAHDPGASALMRRELALMKRNPRHRSSRATLRQLARHNLFWQVGRSRADVMGRLPLAQVGVAVMRRLAARYGRDRTAAEDALCARRRRCSAPTLRAAGEPARRWPGGAGARWSRPCLTSPGGRPRRRPR